MLHLILVFLLVLSIVEITFEVMAIISCMRKSEKYVIKGKRLGIIWFCLSYIITIICTGLNV